ncbi:MAG: hypothetical protein ACK5HL_04145 [Bacilli bacterium]
MKKILSIIMIVGLLLTTSNIYAIEKNYKSCIIYIKHLSIYNLNKGK